MPRYVFVGDMLMLRVLDPQVSQLADVRIRESSARRATSLTGMIWSLSLECCTPRLCRPVRSHWVPRPHRKLVKTTTSQMKLSPFVQFNLFRIFNLQRSDAVNL